MALGIGATLKLGGAGGSPGGSPPYLTEVAVWCTNIDPGGAPAEVDATPYQPGIPNPVKVTEPGLDDLPLNLTVKGNAEAWAFFSAIKGLMGLAYEYGPLGETLGNPKETGLFNVLMVGSIKAAPEALSVFEVNLRRTTRDFDTY